MKITVGQLRRIIKEEVEQEKVRRIVRETVRSELNEGVWDNIKGLASAVFTGKVGDMAIPKGVSKTDWVYIMNQFNGKAPQWDNDAAWAYINSMTQQSKAGKEILGFKTWQQRAQDEMDSEKLSREADQARKNMEDMTKRMKQQLADQELERAASEERYAKKAAKRDAEMKQDEENREYREKSKKSQRQFAQALAGAMYNPGGSSGGGRVSDSW